MTDPEWADGDATEQLWLALMILGHCIDEAASVPTFWRWAIITAHNALHCACVIRLSQTDGTGALTDRSEKDLRRYHEHGSRKAVCDAHGVPWIMKPVPYPAKTVASLTDLLARLPDPVGPIRLKANPPDSRDLACLTDWRNDFVHQGDWSQHIHVPTARQWCRTAIRVTVGILDLPGQRAPSKREPEIRVLLANIAAVLDASARGPRPG